MLVDSLQMLGDDPSIIGLPKEKVLSQPGPLVVVTGEARWYPRENITIMGVYLAVGTSPTGADLIIELTRNGVSIGQYTLTSGTFNTPRLSVGESLVVGDYISVNVIQVGTTEPGANLGMTLLYKSEV